MCSPSGSTREGGAHGARTSLIVSGVLVSASFVVLFAAVVLRQAIGTSEWLPTWGIVSLFVLGTIAFSAQRFFFETDRTVRESVLFTLRASAGFFLLALVYWSRAAGVGEHAIGDLLLVVALIAGFLLLHRVDRLPEPSTWGFALLIGLVMAIFFYHAAGMGTTTVRARTPYWAAIVTGICLFVLPRYVPESVFLWTTSRTTAAVVVLGLIGHAFGSYSVGSLVIEPWHGSVSLLVTETDVMRSVFPNPNTLGLLAFAGTFAALVELRRTLEDLTVPILLAVPGALLVINALGLYLSNARAGLLAAVIASAIYLAHVAYGRRVLPLAVAASLSAVR